jgi:hypothetical protein
MVSAVEHCSGRQLTAFSIFLCFCGIAFFIIGGSGPTASTAHVVLFGTCIFNKKPRVEEYTDCTGDGQQRLPDLSAAPRTHQNVMFYADIPHRPFTMSRWFHMVMSTLRIDVEDYQADVDPAIKEIDGKGRFVFKVGLFGRNSNTEEWKLLKVSNSFRDIVCSGLHLSCENVPFFHLHSSYYRHYHINLHATVQSKSLRKIKLKEVWFSVIHWNVKFSQIFLAVKTVLFPVSLILLVWYGYKIFGKGRQSWLLERLSFALGVALVTLNFPVDWIILVADAPGLTLWNDIRQGFFYTVLACFWLIFVSEHAYEEKQSNSLQSYWKFIIPIILTCLTSLIYVLAERGIQISDPFHTVWTTEDTNPFIWAFIALIGCLAAIYGIILIVLGVMAMIRMYHGNFKQKTQGFRLNFLLGATLITIILTIGGWLTMSVTESGQGSDEPYSLELSSAFPIGTYGLWNLYTFAVMILFSPAKIKDDIDDITVVGTAKLDDGQHLLDETS